MVTYESAYKYLECSTEIEDRVSKLKQIISYHYDNLLAAAMAGTNNIQEYWLDDGQSKIKTTYRTSQDVMKAIAGLEELLTILEVKLNKQNAGGSIVRLVDGKIFITGIINEKNFFRKTYFLGLAASRRVRSSKAVQCRS